MAEPLRSKILRFMQQKHYAQVKTTPHELDKTVAKTANAWGAFTNFRLVGSDEKANLITDRLGYEDKRRPDVKDPKELFDYSDLWLSTWHKQWENKKSLRANKTTHDFLHSLTELSRALKLYLAEIGKNFSYDLAGIETELQEAELIIRCVRYSASSSEQEFLAPAHHDQNLTIALYESHPGLEIKVNSAMWRKVPILKTACVIYAGYKFYERTANLPHGPCLPTQHRVRNTHPLRSSIIAFVALKNTDNLQYTPWSKKLLKSLY